jgi:hypothetical protein
VGVGHRVDHGGITGSEPVLIDDHVMSELAVLVPLAPLHQPHNIARSVRSPQPASLPILQRRRCGRRDGLGSREHSAEIHSGGKCGTAREGGEPGIVGQSALFAQLKFATGLTDTADVVIAADGIQSSL